MLIFEAGRHIKCKNDNLVEAIPHIYLSFQQYSCPIWATPISISNTETSQQSQIHPTKPGEHPCYNFNHIKWILSCIKYLTKNVNNKKIHINICSKMIFFFKILKIFSSPSKMARGRISAQSKPLLITPASWFVSWSKFVSVLVRLVKCDKLEWQVARLHLIG